MIIKIANVKKSIKGKTVLDKINFEFISGNKYAIVGHNGSGKTMFLKLLSGLILPTEGKIFIDNKEMHKDFRFYDSQGLIIETTRFYPNLTGFENLKLLASIKKKISDDDIKEVLEKVNLTSSINLKVNKYSLGMNQRLAIAQAIMEDPDILLLDEPTIALDDNSRDIFFGILDEFKMKNKIIVVATNEIHDLNKRYDKFIKINNGEITKSGETYEYE
ncbi:ABC transporter ATP-binding protein [Bacillus sp. APMAM]|nr:ABC transporter ATP-binding protein [Bacillus sp. APMAM]RTZ53899.1 ABC transporter ATP-binding protein [Bacillus sp. SAJ1]